MSFPPDLAGRRATVMGLGLFGGGVAVTRWLLERGAEVTVTDLRGRRELAPAIAELAGLEVRYVLGEHRSEDFEQVALVVANPAVGPDNPWLAQAREQGVRISSELELFLATSRARIALITGTQGKSSTTAFLAQLLDASGIPAVSGGNIGAPLLGHPAADDPQRVCAVEISSYQLEALPPSPCDGALRPRVEAVLVTNVLLDHLERHGTPAAYEAAKARVLELLAPSGTAWLPAELVGRPGWNALSEPGSRVVSHGEGGRLRCEEGRFLLEELLLGRTRDLTVPGRFQRENALLALGAAHGLGADPERLAAAVERLTGLPHRLAPLGEAGGVRVVDNGVSTTPDSTVAALGEVTDPCTLLVGGRRKRSLAFDDLVTAARERRVRVVAFGEAGGELAQLFGEGGVEARAVAGVEEAVEHGLEGTPAGGVLLFSPACSSFDAYPNFRSRAAAFAEAVERWRLTLPAGRSIEGSRR